MSRSLLVGLVLATGTLPAQPSRSLGTVHFETSCAPSTRAAFAKGIALLHSFGFGDAIRSFNEVLAADWTQP